MLIGVVKLLHLNIIISANIMVHRDNNVVEVKSTFKNVFLINVIN